jgi:hypothetical protein
MIPIIVDVLLIFLDEQRSTSLQIVSCPPNMNISRMCKKVKLVYVPLIKLLEEVEY